MDITSYERCKFDLADVLREAASLLPIEAGDSEGEIQDLYRRLAEDRFDLAVVGRFSRGKSSLMNAILGGEWLPTGLAPRTSVVTTVRFADAPSARIFFEGAALDHPIALEALAEYVTEQHNPGNKRHVRLAEIGLPADLLRRGVHFIDTPGLGSAIAENTMATEVYLPRADAVLLVTSFDSPLSTEEMAIIERARRADARVFVVVNKADAVTPAQREEVLAFIAQQMKGSVTDIYPTSARQALTANAAGDAPGFAASGVGALKQALLDFLLNEKGTLLLRRLGARIGAIVAASPSEAARPLQERLSAALSAFAQSQAPEHAHTSFAATPRLEGCEICLAVADAAFDFLRKFQYDLTVRKEARSRLHEAGGFCRTHAWQYHRLASTRGVSIAYPDLLQAWADRFADLRGASGVAAATAIQEASAHAEKSCPACAACARAEAAALTKYCSRPQAALGAEAMSAFCLKHAGLACVGFTETMARDRFLEGQARACRELAEDMRRYALKFDGVQRANASEAEERAAKRAIDLVAGLPAARFVGTN